MRKDELRKQIRQAKRQFSQQQLEELSLIVVNRLRQRLDEVQLQRSVAVRMLMAYWPLNDEVDVRQLLDVLVAQGVTVLLPRVVSETAMELRCYTGRTDLAVGAFGIMEPVGEVFVDYAAIDIALVPGMAFDAQGRRLGRGRGYYDRFLATLPSIYKIGVCFDFQKVEEVPSDEHDVAVDSVV